MSRKTVLLFTCLIIGTMSIPNGILVRKRFTPFYFPLFDKSVSQNNQIKTDLTKSDDIRTGLTQNDTMKAGLTKVDIPLVDESKFEGID